MTMPPEIIAKLEQAGMYPSAIATDAADAFENAKFIEATLDKWLADQKATRPHLFIDGVQVDLETLAFGDGNMTARARLVNQIGEAAAKERAAAWGLKSLTDKRAGKRPFGNGGNEKAKGDNPWSAEGWNLTKQGSLVRTLGEAKAAQIAKAAGSHLGATKPARAA